MLPQAVLYELLNPVSIHVHKSYNTLHTFLLCRRSALLYPQTIANVPFRPSLPFLPEGVVNIFS
jgi:hypothetical protein